MVANVTVHFPEPGDSGILRRVSHPRPYLPRRLIRRVDAAPGHPQAVETAGVVLFVDISGFTTLTERLSAEKGAAGVDQLARVLDEKLGLIVDRVDAHGGEVVTFAGDAVLAWWEADAAGAMAVAQALACSTEIAAALTAPIEGITIRARQAIAAGPARLVGVGVAPRVVLVQGEVITQLAEVAGRPPGGPATLTRAAAAVAGARMDPSTPPPDDDVAPAYISPDLAAWTAEHVAELRVVTTFLARVPPDLPVVALHEAVCVVQRELARHRGALVSVCSDDKGVLLVGAFGLPVREVFHPADPARAAIAVLAAARVPVGIGIATGRTYFGATRAGRWRRVDVIGAPMNLAARLMMTGEGAWCDAATARGARGVVGVDEARVLRFKGFSAPVTVWRLLDRAGDAHEVGFVGRTAALQAIDRALAGAGGWLRVVGEPGIGKSAVLREARQRAIERGVEVLAVGGAGADVLLGIWAPALRGVLGGEGVEALGELAPLIEPILGLPPRETAATAELRGFVRAARTVDLVGQLLTVAPGGRPRMVLVDDGTALDERSIEVAERLAAAGVLVLEAARPGAPAVSGVVELALGPLGTPEVAALVRARLGLPVDGPLPVGLVEWLMQRAGGHPQFLLELLALAQEQGFLQIEADGRVTYFDRAGLEGAAVPDTVQAALVARLGRLPAASIAVLKAASVLGVEVDRAALDALVPGGPDVDLPPLLDAGWLIPRGGKLVFPSVTAREVVHSLLVRDQRRRLHGAAVAWFGSREADPAVLADHLAHAGAFTDAIVALDRAWRRAIDAGLPRAAASLARRALALDAEASELGEPSLPAGDRARWHLRVAEACRGFGDTALAITHLDAAAALAGVRQPTSIAGWRRLLLTQLLGHLAERLVPVRSRPEDPLRASILNLLSLTAFLRAQPPEVLLTNALWAVRLGWRRAVDGASSTALASSMLSIATSGLPNVAWRYAEEGRRRAALARDPREEVDAALGPLMLALAHMRWAELDALRAVVLPQLRASRSDTLHAAFLGVLACADLVTGRVERCADRCDEMIRLSERESYLQALGWARNLQASLALLADDTDGARRCADEARAILARRREPDHLAPLALRAQVALRSGDLAGAQAEIAPLEIALATELVGVTGLETVATPIEVHLRAALAGDATALARADRAFLLLRRYVRQFPLGQARLLTLQALRRQARGGRPDLREAADLAARQGLPLEQLRLAELGAGDPAPLRAALACGWTGGVGVEPAPPPAPAW